MFAIFKREVRSCFHGMIGYVLTAFLLVASAIYFVALNLGYGLPDFGYYTLYNTIFMLLFYFPVLTMRSFAEERRTRTDQLLLTSPVPVTQTLEVSCVIDTINKAKDRRDTELPLIIHSDRGSQYVSQAYREATAKMQRSYSKKAFPWDNACIESFHALIKREWLNRFKIRDYQQAYRLVFEYIEAFYNTKRIHSHCDFMSPNDFERLYEQIQTNELLLVG